MNVPKKRVKIVKTTDHIYSWGCICLCIKAQLEYVHLQRRWRKHQDDTENLNIVMNCWDNPLSSCKKERGRWGEKGCILGCVCKFEYAQECPWALNCVALLLDLVVFPVTERSVPLPATPEQFMALLSCLDSTRNFSSSQFEKSSPSWLQSPAQEGHKFVEKVQRRAAKMIRGLEGFSCEEILSWGCLAWRREDSGWSFCALSVSKWVYKESCRGTSYKSV